MERLLGWDVVGVVVPLLLGIGVLPLANSRWAKFNFLLAASILSVKLGLVAVRTPNVDIPPTAGLLGLAYAAIVVLLVLTFRRVDWLEVRDSTRLKAGKLPTPAINHPVPKDALMVFLGSNVAWATRMPHTILEMQSQQMLVIDRRGKKELVVSLLRIYDDRGHIIARIGEGEFWVESSMRKERPNASTLVVFDRKDAEVLRVSFLNRRTVAVTGVFRSPGGQTAVIITPEMLQLGGMRMTGSSMGESGHADIVID